MTFMEFLLHLTRNSALSDYSYTESYLTSATPMTMFPRDTTYRSTKEYPLPYHTIHGISIANAMSEYPEPLQGEMKLRVM